MCHLTYVMLRISQVQPWSAALRSDRTAGRPCSARCSYLAHLNMKYMKRCQDCERCFFFPWWFERVENKVDTCLTPVVVTSTNCVCALRWNSWLLVCVTALHWTLPLHRVFLFSWFFFFNSSMMFGFYRFSFGHVSCPNVTSVFLLFFFHGYFQQVLYSAVSVAVLFPC